MIPAAVEAAAKKSGFLGRVKESKVPYCLRPGAEVGNVCPYPWWTLVIRLGTLWKCPHCAKVSILEWIEAGGWGMKSWATYRSTQEDFTHGND